MAKLSPPLAELVWRLEVPPTASTSEFAPKLITSLVSLNEQEASKYATEFLVAQIELMLSPDSHDKGVSSELMYVMELDGFMTLKRLEGLRTPASWLYNELTPVLGEAGAVEFLDMIEYMLTLQFEPIRIDDWLKTHFIKSHAGRGSPKIVLIASEEGAIQMLVPVKGLTSERLATIAERIAVQTINENRRFRDAMRNRFDLEQAAGFEARMYDAQKFQETVSRLVEDKTGAEIDYPTLMDAGLLSPAMDPGRADPFARKRDQT